MQVEHSGQRVGAGQDAEQSELGKGRGMQSSGLRKTDAPDIIIREPRSPNLDTASGGRQMHPSQSMVPDDGPAQSHGRLIRSPVERLGGARELVETCLIDRATAERRVAGVIRRVPLRGQQRLIAQDAHPRLSLLDEFAEFLWHGGGHEHRQLDRGREPRHEAPAAATLDPAASLVEVRLKTFRG
jgi:hypothetical protein